MKLIFLWIATLLYSANIIADDERFSLSIGNFVTDSGLNFRLDSEASGPGTPINFENDLGLDNQETVSRIDGHYWFNDTHRIDFSYFDLSRSATRSIDQTIEFGDETFNVNTTVNTNFDNTIYKLGYSYYFYNQPQLEFGALVGLYILDIGASISATNINQTEATDATAPLPVIGFRGRYFLTETISVNASYEYFSINPDEDLDGRLADLLFTLEYQVLKHVSLGVGFNRVDFDLDVVDNQLRFDTDWRYDGYLVYVSMNY